MTAPSIVSVKSLLAMTLYCVATATHRQSSIELSRIINHCRQFFRLVYILGSHKYGCDLGSKQQDMILVFCRIIYLIY